VKCKIKLLFRYVNSTLWSKPGHFNSALSKGPAVTTWIWNLHSDAHDFSAAGASPGQRSSAALVSRKVFSSNTAHLSLLFFWISGIHFHGAYFSNYSAWLKDAKHCAGHYLLSGIFQLWRAEGIFTTGDLKCAASLALIATIIFLGGSYFHMHAIHKAEGIATLSIHHLSLLLGLGAIAISGHQYHISAPLNLLLESGACPSHEDLFSKDLMGTTGLAGQHHFYVGVVFIIGGMIARVCKALPNNKVRSPHAELARSLAILGSFSAAFAFQESAIPIYPLLSSDYASTLSLFCHHMWVALALMVGSGAHASIFCITDYSAGILKHRDVIMCHLIWVNLALGLHSFGLYIHNDTLQALSHRQDMFDDNSIQLKPV
jgi:photosystem I P700 chlorophyll a apoprotein A1